MGTWCHLLRVRSRNRLSFSHAQADGSLCRFLYGFPPFHDDTPEKVFENILSRRIEWHEDAIDISPDARDFMERLLCSDASRRLGAGGTAEVKAHPFLKGISWDNLLMGEVDFIPKISDPESTDYFDARGATAQIFSDDEGADPPTDPNPTLVRPHAASEPLLVAPSRQSPRERSDSEPAPQDDFGTFNFRNLPVLKAANDDVIRKMRDEQMLPPLTIPAEQSPPMHARPMALAGKPTKSRTGSIDIRVRFLPRLSLTPKLTLPFPAASFHPFLPFDVVQQLQPLSFQRTSEPLASSIGAAAGSRAPPSSSSEHQRHRKCERARSSQLAPDAVTKAFAIRVRSPHRARRLDAARASTDFDPHSADLVAVLPRRRPRATPSSRDPPRGRFSAPAVDSSLSAPESSQHDRLPHRGSEPDLEQGARDDARADGLSVRRRARWSRGDPRGGRSQVRCHLDGPADARRCVLFPLSFSTFDFWEASLTPFWGGRSRRRKGRSDDQVDQEPFVVVPDRRRLFVRDQH